MAHTLDRAMECSVESCNALFLWCYGVFAWHSQVTGVAGAVIDASRASPEPQRIGRRRPVARGSQRL